MWGCGGRREDSPADAKPGADHGSFELAEIGVDSQPPPGDEPSRRQNGAQEEAHVSDAVPMSQGALAGQVPTEVAGFRRGRDSVSFSGADGDEI